MNNSVNFIDFVNARQDAAIKVDEQPVSRDAKIRRAIEQSDRKANPSLYRDRSQNVSIDAENIKVSPGSEAERLEAIEIELSLIGFYSMEREYASVEEFLDFCKSGEPLFEVELIVRDELLKYPNLEWK